MFNQYVSEHSTLSEEFAYHVMMPAMLAVAKHLSGEEAFKAEADMMRFLNGKGQ